MKKKSGAIYRHFRTNMLFSVYVRDPNYVTIRPIMSDDARIITLAELDKEYLIVS